MKWAWFRILIGVVVALLAATARAAEPNEEDIFGAPDVPADDNATEPVVPGPPRDIEPDEDGGVFDEEPSNTSIVVPEDPLAIGGQLYLRFATTIADRGTPGEQALSMPNLLDLYLDARPEERVRGFISGRLTFDPTINSGDTDLLGGSRDVTSVVLDQMWIKTDIARHVFLTIGQERIKWGATRLWNPNDFVNQRRRDPLALFDERTGVPMVKVHIPYETLNFYLIGLVGEASQLDAPGAAFRFEAAFSSTEIALSGIAGKGRKTSFGFDISTALGELDFTAEVSLTDERDTPKYSGTLSFDPVTLPTVSPRGEWLPRVSAGLQYAFKPNDDDVMYIGVEYFWNPGGVDETSLYPALLLGGDYQPFYVGQHYVGLSWAVPQPGSWDDTSFTLSALGNLSDTSFVARLDFSQTLHTRLKFEAYAQGHFGERGGEFRFALDIPEIPADLYPPDGFGPISVPAPAMVLGLNLRIAI